MAGEKGSTNGGSKASKPSFSMSLGGGNSKKGPKRSSSTAAATAKPAAAHHDDDSDGEMAAPRREYIESLADGAVLGAEKQEEKGPLVIPLAVNAWAEEEPAPDTAAASSVATAAADAAGASSNGPSAGPGEKLFLSSATKCLW